MSLRAYTLIAGLLVLNATSAFAAIAIVDQQNTVGGSNTGGSISLGQSFTPTLNSINVADFSLATLGPTSTVRLDIFNGAGYTGLLLGSSAPVTFSNLTLQTVEFNFASSIALVPGQMYTLRLALVSGAQYRAEFSGANPYAGGTAFSDTGASISTVDLVFAEGIPEPSIAVLLLVGGVVAAGSWGGRLLGKA